MTAQFGNRTVSTAVAVRWVREDHHLQVLAERDHAEALLAEAEREIARLRTELMAQGRPRATIGDATSQPDRYVRRLCRDARSAGRLRGEPALVVLAKAISNTIRFQPIDGAAAAVAEEVR